jgi:hypothetical protein
VRLRPEHLAPLDAAMIGRMQLQEGEIMERDFPPLTPGVVENQRLGRFALWGFGPTLERERR